VTEAQRRRGRPIAPPEAVPADALIHPAVLGSVALLVVNHHFLQAAWPGFVTGKLSDLAGLAFFPLVLLGIWEVALWAAHRWHGPRRRPLWIAIIATGLVFSLVKSTAAGATAFGWVLAVGPWILPAVAGVLTGHAGHMREPVPIAHDITDLVALPMLLVALRVGVSRVPRGDSPTRRPGSRAPSEPGARG
jgi:hypothetical protein